MHDRIGLAAGDIYQTLEQNQETPLSRLARKTGLPVNLFYMGLGWLAKENKIDFRLDKRTIYVSLKK
ncbi:hypothetical protein A2Y85_01995 [candidate division WOR-3 bacterium RBG_13_43_14]|uniref:Uncharacterized protein n=1 Tax=candidate division WOR-3 bacterium RBG_13_43_14 TaxID=1802590 RepID=A0A1F4U2B8_UNCW3|nr:MAG: hypothetical protein A2Y85_01995 [candidate division WOR-3 bacterium RBG_13_43_14]